MTLSTGINAIALSFHARTCGPTHLVALPPHRSTVAADGHDPQQCRVHDGDGALVASFCVDAMVQGMAPPSPVTRTSDVTLLPRGSSDVATEAGHGAFDGTWTVLGQCPSLSLEMRRGPMPVQLA